jgi:hypothetical protein
VAALVRLSVVPFDTALTVNDWDCPLVTLAEVGLIAMELMTLKTVAVAVELKAWALAVIVEVPVLTPVRMPVLASMVATAGVPLDQETPLFT